MLRVMKEVKSELPAIRTHVDALVKARALGILKAVYHLIPFKDCSLLIRVQHDRPSLTTVRTRPRGKVCRITEFTYFILF